MSTSCFDYVKKKVDFTNPGSAIKDEFVKEFDDNGVEYLVKSGETDLQAYYNSQRDECDLSVILSTMISSGVNPANCKIVYSDDYDDVVEIQQTPPDKLFNAAKNFKKNEALIKQYEAEIEKLKEQQEQSSSEVINNANE